MSEVFVDLLYDAARDRCFLSLGFSPSPKGFCPEKQKPGASTPSIPQKGDNANVKTCVSGYSHRLGSSRVIRLLVGTNSPY